MVSEVLFSGRERVVFKVDDSSQGRGIHIINKDQFDLLDIMKIGNGLFQPYILQHETLAQFESNVVATLRLTTISSKTGGIELRAAYLRMGRAADKVVRSQSHIRVPIDLSAGSMPHVGHSVDWLEIPSHPDSSIEFSGQVMPGFDKCKDIALNLHAKIPYVRCIGWDLTVDEAGEPHVLEWNGAHNDIKYSESTQGPCFADLGWESLWKQ